jgi:hypothetical protein
MHFSNPSEGDKIPPVVLAEMPMNELYGPSETLDTDTGRPITRLEEFRREEAARFGGKVFPHIGEHLSDFAKAHNKTLKRGAASGAFLMAVLAYRTNHNRLHR